MRHLFSVTLGRNATATAFVIVRLLPVFQGFKQQALAVSTDPEHKFELALQLGDVQTAYQLASEAKV